MGDTAELESQWSRSHILRSSAGDMLGLEGNQRQRWKKRCQRSTHKHPDSSDHMAGVSSSRHWALGGWGIQVLHRALRVPGGVANGELIRAENGGLRQN